MADTFDLERELAAGEEDAKRTVEKERENAGRALAAALETKNRKTLPPAKVIGLVRRAVKMMDDGRPAAAKAAQLCMKALDEAPDFALANHAMALILERLGRLSAALNFYERAWKLDPSDAEIYLNLGMAAWKLDMLEAAEKFLRLHNKMRPGATAGVANLAGLLRDMQKFEDSVELLRAAIYADAENAELWNSLGTTLLESGEPEQAITFYQEAARLNPDYARAHYNMAFALDLMGDSEPAIEHFRKALALDPKAEDRVTMEHGLSMALLAQGEMKEGWALYERRLHPLYKKVVQFAVQAPFWSGADPAQVRGKRLLLIGEQGLGDEIMHATALSEAFDLVGPDGSVGLVCENRMMAIMERSFPQLDFVGRHATIFKEGVQIRGVLDAETQFKPDLWAPLGSLQRAVRPSQESFARSGAGPMLKADPERVSEVQAQLDALPPGLRVGFVWKSKLMTGNRTKYFSPFELWRPVLETPGCTFVCLQYGDVDEELALCERDFGVKIHRIEGLDLMNDLEGVGVLGSLLDVSVGQNNTSLALTSAFGGETFVLSPSKTQWTTFGTDHLPWLPGSTLFAPDKFRDWTTPIARIAEALAERSRAAKADVA